MRSGKYLAAIVITVLAAAAVVLGGVFGIAGLPVLTLADIPSPEETITDYLDCIVSGDFDGAVGYMYDCTGLGLSEPPEDEIDRILFDAVTDSYAYSIESISEDGLTATVEISFTCCDISLMSGDLEELVTQLIKEGAWTGEDVQSTEFVLDAVARAAETLSEDTSEYLVSARIELPMIYRDSRWMVRFSDELYYMLLGQPMEGEE